MIDERQTASAGSFRPAVEHEIADLETVRVLADPLRFRILQAMSTRPMEQWTVKVLARALGEPVTKLYYHVGLLEQHGILVVTGSALVSGILEKRYQLAAERFSIARGLLSPNDAAAGEAFDSILATVLDTARIDIRAAVQAGIASVHSDPAEDEDGPGRVVLSHGVDRLSDSDAADFRRRLRALCQEFGQHAMGMAGSDASGVAHEPTRPFGLVVAFYPVVDVQPGDAPPSHSEPRGDR